MEKKPSLLSLIIVFIPLFGIFGFIDAEKAAREPIELENFILLKLEYQLSGHKKTIKSTCNDITDNSENTQEAHYELTWLENNQPVCQFDVDDNLLSCIPVPGTFLKQQVRIPPKMLSPLSHEKITDIIKDKDYFTDLKLLAVALLSSTSGYSLGYRIGAEIATKPSNEKLFALLNDPNKWKKFKIDYLKTRIRSLEFLTSKMKNKSLRDDMRERLLIIENEINEIERDNESKSGIANQEGRSGRRARRLIFSHNFDRFNQIRNIMFCEFRGEVFSFENKSDAWSDYWWLQIPIILALMIYLLRAANRRMKVLIIAAYILPIISLGVIFFFHEQNFFSDNVSFETDRTLKFKVESIRKGIFSEEGHDKSLISESDISNTLDAYAIKLISCINNKGLFEEPRHIQLQLNIDGSGRLSTVEAKDDDIQRCIYQKLNHTANFTASKNNTWSVATISLWYNSIMNSQTAF